MKKDWLSKTLVIGIIFLYIGISFQSAFANDVSRPIISDDTTPPVSKHSLDPPEPDGLNGWYVSDLNVTLTASDDKSGVKEIKYRINSGPVETIIGDTGYFTLTKEFDADDLLVEYWAIDYTENEENPHNEFTIDMDQTDPTIDLTYEVGEGNPWEGWDFHFIATAIDFTSGMDRVEFYLNDELQSSVSGPGPYYEWIWHYDGQYADKLRVVGLICKAKITDEYVKFFAFFVMIGQHGWNGPDIYADAYDNAGNMARDRIEHPTNVDYFPGIYLFKRVTLPNNYTGKIGKFFINAIFDIN